MTSIEWTDTTWNPVRGCSRVSPGCDHCYAMGQAHRFSGAGGPYEGLTTIRRGKVDWSGRVRFVPEALDVPLHWRKPRRVFVNSMSDLFHASLSNEEIAAVFGVMAACPRHTFQVLTKRARRMREWFEWAGRLDLGKLAGAAATALGRDRTGPRAVPLAATWPLPNVWLGVSAEDQQRADERIPDLIATPAAVRFVSAEPLLGPIDLHQYVSHFCGCGIPGDACDGWKSREGCPCAPKRLDWCIAGGESGHGARPCDVAWIRSIVEQCRTAEVPCFVKQLGANVEHFGRYAPQPVRYDRVDPYGCAHLHRIRLRDRKGADPSEWPAELRVRQFPEVRS